jgi:hypothetical protein
MIGYYMIGYYILFHVTALNADTLIYSTVHSILHLITYFLFLLLPGVVEYSDLAKVSIADIPGLVDGASENKGLGHDFLRHIERTKVST